jgi:hypothetical protein
MVSLATWNGAGGSCGTTSMVTSWDPCPVAVTRAYLAWQPALISDR